MSHWQQATLVESGMVSRTVKSLTLLIDAWQPHLCGQFYDVSVDGGKISRCYSVASAPEQPGVIELGVELFAAGAVSPKLHALEVGDSVMVSGPHGLPVFTWNYKMSGSLVLVGGGSGVVPLMSMVRHYSAYRTQSPRSVTIISSAPTNSDLVYHQELLEVSHTYSEIIYLPIATQDASWQGRGQRIDSDLLRTVIDAQSQVYVCGSFGFVSQIGDLAQSFTPASHVHREYFG